MLERPEVRPRLVDRWMRIDTISLFTPLIFLAVLVFSFFVVSRFGLQALVFALIGMIAFALMTLVSLRNLSFALMCWFFSMAGFRWMGMVRMPGLPDFSFDRLFLVWIIGIFLLRLILDRRRLKGPYAADVLVLLQAFYVLIQLNATGSIHIHAWVISSLSPMFGFFYGKYVVERENQIRDIMLFLLGLAIYFSFTAIAEHFHWNSLIWPKQILDSDVGHLWQPGRSRGPVMHPPYFGQLLAMLLLVHFYLFTRPWGGVRRALLFISLFMCTLGLFFAYTRGPWLAAAVGILTLAVFRPNYRKVVAVVVIVCVLAGAFGLLQVADTEFLQKRMENTNTIQNRMIFLASAWGMFRDHPVFGIGYLKYTKFREQYSFGTEVPFYGYVRRSFSEGMSIHDIYIGRLAEEGLVSVLLLAAFTFVILRTLIARWRSGVCGPWYDRDMLVFILAAMVCYHVGGMVIDYRNFDLLNVFYYFFAGIIYGYKGRTPAAAPAAAPREKRVGVR